ncbi:hypothetical protein DSAG12_00220 [Promethearchaeum syntrophicum]|uniref:Uncharacterized protein n=1 Tax=Promethearchaeum syntrophicum TaxID=2594042 RepID=A0A5B9D6J5_9ARCH|nr:hypothetical protein [Candidatus Prometheoarchaeum syntrophicum]QEE14407.1 hypothetical protein DSAG12_00220 [Candidatus Prometheoarchaeum syntrophicum]
MVKATLKDLNAEILKYQSLTEGIADTTIIKSSKEEKIKISSDELFIEEDNVHIYLTFNPNVKKIRCIIYLTEVDSDFVEMMISRVGLPTTETNIQNYQRDPTLVEKYWNAEFIPKYNELMKYLRRSKIKFLFQERFKPTFNKNRNNEIVDNFG